MPRESKSSESSGTDIFQILTKRAEEEKKRQREKLLAPLGLKEYFAEGTIAVNRRICKGLECKLCIKACPTNALFWKKGEVGLTRELCIYCGACVLSCIVDDCIRISRKRPDGTVEEFSSPRGFLALQQNIDAGKRIMKVLEVFPTAEAFIKWQRKSKSRALQRKKRRPSFGRSISP
jgi:Fe-S-cluster-containing hydrogenase component 2